MPDLWAQPLACPCKGGDVTWLVESFQEGNASLHGPFETRKDAARWAGEVLSHQGQGERALRIRKMHGTEVFEIEFRRKR